MKKPQVPYNHLSIESKWQKVWEDTSAYKALDNSDKPKFYSLIEFPFPSGSGLHTGHIRSNVAMDIISRKRRSEGYNVLFPIGWDAFGLPTENYAIKTGIHPIEATKQNTDTFRRQLKTLGFSFDWSREVNTSDPEYYKWTQWIFLQMYKKGLAYKHKMAINWCPKDKIGLANEEVIDGKCERCGTQVEKREKEQWMLAITKYADRLDKDLDTVDYLERIKIQQRNWIGKSEGSEIEFKVSVGEKNINVFTTRADTLFGVTYVVLSPEHSLVSEWKEKITNKKEIEDYIASVKSRTEIDRTSEGKEKTGVELKGIHAFHPITNEEIPIWIADYVLASYGTGAVMAVPAHDERDNEFAQKFNLRIKEVIEPLLIGERGADAVKEDQPFIERQVAAVVVKHWEKEEYLVIKWTKSDWVGFVTGGIDKNEDVATAALREVEEETGYTDLEVANIADRKVHAKFYQLLKKENRFAHYQPVLIHLKSGARKEVDSGELAIHTTEWISKDKIEAILAGNSMRHILWSLIQPEKPLTDDGLLKNSDVFSGMSSDEARKAITEAAGGKMVTTFKLRDWIFSRQRYWGEPIPMIHCKKCGWIPVPEKDLPVTLPLVAKYQPTDSGESPLAAISEWVNVKCPTCDSDAKRETDTMPNWAGSSWYFLRYTDPHNKNAFAGVDKLNHWTPVDWYNGGMEHTTLHLLYSRFWHKFLFDIGLVPTAEPYKKRTSHGLILAEGGVKMSKSIGNVINPDEIVENMGADTLRLYEMFMGPFDQPIPWSTDNIVGSRRFIERVWNTHYKVSNEAQVGSKVESMLHKTIMKVGEDIESMSFNTAVSSLMILLNTLEKEEAVSKEVFETFLKLLAPFIPHVTEEIWSELGNKESIHSQRWPQYDKLKTIDSVITIAVQINGKTRTTVEIEPGNTEEIVTKKALEIPEISKWMEGKNVRRIVFVKDKIINIIVDLKTE